MNRPLIVRVVTAPDWTEAYYAVWKAMWGRPSLGRKIPVPRLPWPDLRSLCLSFATRCAEEWGDQELSAAWATLGADPAGPEWRTLAGGRTYVPVLKALAAAITADPALLDDDLFAAALAGWRFLERAGADGEQDLIVATQRHGAALKIDKAEMLAWARLWAKRT